MAKQLMFRIKDRLGDVIFDIDEKSPKRAYVSVHRSDVKRAASVFFEDFGARFLSMTASDNARSFEILYHFSFESLGKVISVRTFVEKDSAVIDSVSQVLGPCSQWAEKEIHELLGIDFTGSPRVARPAADKPAVDIAPYYPMQDKPPVFRLNTDNDIVVGVDIELGHNQRGIEALSGKRPFDEAAFLAERICASCSAAHSLAYANAVEDILGIEPPLRALHIRTVMAEIERLSSHLLWLGVMGHYAGYPRLFMSAARLRQPVLDTLEAVTGNRIHTGMIKPGGVRRDIDASDAGLILKNMSELSYGLESLKSMALDNPVIQRRFKGAGLLKRQDAAAYAAVGPVARASGIDIDSRKNDAHAAYDRVKWRMIVQQSGDVFARVVVRILEMHESIEIIKQCLEKMPQGPTDVRIKQVPSGEGIGMAESAAGECLHYVRSDGSSFSVRHKIRSASFMNIPAVRAARLGQHVADAGIILASFDPCYCCAERAIRLQGGL